MINARFKYTMLLSSLPVHPSNLFAAQQTPVSRIQLDKRLTLLDETDARDLACIETLLHWSKINDQQNEAQLFKDVQQKLDSIGNVFLKEIILWRLELRTILSALRRRRAGEIAQKSVFQGFGRWPGLINRHWHEQNFGIGHMLPWINEASNLLEQDKTFELEKLMLNLVWRHYAKVGSHHYFDFPAVVIYVLRWDVINRWASYNKDLAILHFDELVTTALNEVIS